MATISDVIVQSADVPAHHVQGGPVEVDFTRPKKLYATVEERIRMTLFIVSISLTQLWHDLLERPQSLLTIAMTDLITRLLVRQQAYLILRLSVTDISQFFNMARGTPRLATGGPYESITIFEVPSNKATTYETDENVFNLKTRQIINCASNNYAGFSRLEGGSGELIEHAIKKLPFAPGPLELEETLKAECLKLMGFEACEFMPSGFSSNLLAFRTVHQYAQSLSKSCIFLCDADCHNSLLTGAYTNSRVNAAAYKFKHNDLTDLEERLQMLKQQRPDAFVCVVVEGIYSLEGISAPVPAILALKKIYNFSLLVDEAHSFMSLGNSGRGSFEHWQDLGYDCPLDECDVMTCMFSKSAGCTGGMVLARGGLATQLKEESKKVLDRGAERLATCILVRLLDIFRKPELIQRRMAIVRKKGLYAARMLKKAGFQVLSFDGSPIICFQVGSLRQIALFQKDIHRSGLAIAIAGPPATTFWDSRVRVSIFATIPWADIKTAVGLLIKNGIKHKFAGITQIDLNAEKLPADEDFTDVAEKYRYVDEKLMSLVDSLAERYPRSPGIGSHPAVIQSAQHALKRHGIGPCSARWFYGSFDTYIVLEQRLAKLYPSLVQQAGPCRAMVCGDANVTIGSSFAARCAVTMYNKSTHFVLVKRTAAHFVHESIAAAKESKSRPLIYYDSESDVPRLLEQHISKSGPSMATIYLETVNAAGQPLDIVPILKELARLSTSKLKRACLFLDDRKGLGVLGPKRLGYLNHLEDVYGKNIFKDNLGAISKNIEVDVAGSWYNSFGHQGGYVIGPSTVIESLSWNARAYFFSTPPMPMQTVMSNKALELLQDGVV